MSSLWYFLQALREAIEAVTDVNTDLNVERIEVKTKPKKAKKPKKIAVMT